MIAAMEIKFFLVLSKLDLVGSFSVYPDMATGFWIIYAVFPNPLL